MTNQLRFTKMEWQSKIDLSDIFKEYSESENSQEPIDISIISKKVAVLLKNNIFAKNETMQDIIELFEECEDVEDFDSAMHELYNFGDVSKRIWIET